MNIFVSYRRSDEPYAADLIYLELIAEFGKEQVFKDIDNIPIASDFRKVIFDAINRCNVFLALIGPKWIGPKEDGTLRIFDIDDYIRLELQCAIDNNIHIIPVLIGEDVNIPKDLPVGIEKLVHIHGTKLRAGADRLADATKLVNAIKGLNKKKKDSKRTASSTESDLWRWANKGKLVRRYKQYLKEYPNGEHIIEAKQKIEDIRNTFVKPTKEVSKNEYKPTVEFIKVPSCQFIMGDLSHEDEKPVHKVKLDTYFLSTNLVTVGQYKAFCQQMNRSMPIPPRWGWHDSHPMVKVTWFEAMKYCEWLGGSLPTEAEWEYAAKGGKYGWHFSELTTGCFLENSHDRPCDIPREDKNKLGLSDLLGNVSEWCYDWYSSYTATATINPKGPTYGLTRVVRGGSFLQSINSIRPTMRMDLFPDQRYESVGFRVAKNGINNLKI